MIYDPFTDNTDGVNHEARPDARPALTLRSPDEILALQFTEDDIILGDRLLAHGQPLVICAAGGTGKSRLLLQLAGAVVSGREFIGMTTGSPQSRWLILQTENSNRRLQADLGRLRAWLGDDWPRFNEQVMLHTVEHDADGFVSLESLENVAAIEEAILRSKPDVIAVDPLNEFAAGDLNKDSDMRQTLQTLSRVCRRGNPSRAIVTLHHALTGKAGAGRATGYDRSSFARNSKALHAWTRGQINIAPATADNYDQLIVACGKCSNGREFAPFGITLDPQAMIYAVDPSIDVPTWEDEMAGKTSKEPLMSPDRVQELCVGAMSKPELAKAIGTDCGCTRESAYRYMKKAEHARKIAFNKVHETYCSR